MCGERGGTRWAPYTRSSRRKGRRPDVVVVQTTPGIRGHPSQAAVGGEQREWEMSTRSCMKSSGACQDQGASRQVTGVEQRRFPSDRGRRIDQGPRSQTWKGDLDLPVDHQGPASAGRPNRHTGVRHETAQSQIQGTCSSLGLDPRRCSCPSSFGFCSFCLGSTRANFSLRMVRPQLAQQFAERDDENVRQCLRREISTADEADRTMRDATLPFSLGDLRLGSAVPPCSGSFHHDRLDGQSRAEFRGASDL